MSPAQLHADSIVIDGLIIAKWNRELFEDMRKGGLTAANCTVSVWEGFQATINNIVASQTLIRENSDLVIPVKTTADIRKLLLCGADKVSINSAAVKNPDFVAEAADKFGDQCIVVSIDAKKVSGTAEADRWEIFTHGGRQPTGIDAVEFAAKVVARGAGELLVTSMDRDGTKIGYDIDLTRTIADSVRVPVIASGGVGTLDDLVAGIKDGHATAGLAASIFHFGTYSIAEAKRYMADHGIAMRLD